MSEWQLINTTILFPITIWPVNCIRRRTEVPPLEVGCGLSIVTSFYDFTIPEVITLATSYLSMPCLVVESLRRFPQFDDVLRCQQRIDIFIFFFNSRSKPLFHLSVAQPPRLLHWNFVHFYVCDCLSRETSE